MNNSSLLHTYKIKKDINDKNTDMLKKAKLVDDVKESSGRMKLKYSSAVENNFGSSIPNNRLIATGRPTKETIRDRKHMSFVSLVE